MFSHRTGEKCQVPPGRTELCSSASQHPQIDTERSLWHTLSGLDQNVSYAALAIANLASRQMIVMRACSIPVPFGVFFRFFFSLVRVKLCRRQELLPLPSGKKKKKTNKKPTTTTTKNHHLSFGMQHLRFIQPLRPSWCYNLHSSELSVTRKLATSRSSPVKRNELKRYGSAVHSVWRG